MRRVRTPSEHEVEDNGEVEYVFVEFFMPHPLILLFSRGGDQPGVAKRATAKVRQLDGVVLDEDILKPEVAMVEVLGVERVEGFDDLTQVEKRLGF